MQVIADTSGLHHRGEALPGTVRHSLRLKGDNDGGLPRLDPWRLPESKPADPEFEWEGEIRMMGCNADCGRVEILHDGIWGYICSDSWTRKEADVACRALGFSASFGVMPTFGGGTGKVWLGNVSCTGDENSLQSCSHSDWGIHNCDGAKAVGVSCLASDASTETEMAEISTQTERYKSYEVTDLHPGDIESVTSDCDLDIPTPFENGSTDAYVYGDRIADEMAAMDIEMRQLLCTKPELQQTVKELVNAGMRYSAFGLDLRSVLKPTNPDAASLPTKEILDEKIEIIRSIYLRANNHAALHSGYDNRIRYPAQAHTIADLGARDIFERLVSSHYFTNTTIPCPKDMLSITYNVLHAFCLGPGRYCDDR